MKLLILLHHRFEHWDSPPWFEQRLCGEFPQVEIVHRSNYEGIESDLAGADVVLTYSLRPEQFRAAHKLRWIHSPSAAVHQFMFPELVNSDVILTNGRDVHGPVVAEHVMALILALAKNIPGAVRLQQKRIWGKDPMWEQGSRPRDVTGAVLGLIGLGSIGRNVAAKASALGMVVIAVREHPDREKPEGVQEVLPRSELDLLLAKADYVVLAAPVTPATSRLIDSGRLAAMKPEACLINVSRGALVDEGALADALRQRKIAAAALDVFEKEPLPEDSPLWDLPNLLITPHTAGVSEKMWERQFTLFAENLRRYLSGRPLLAMVDKSLGY